MKKIVSFGIDYIGFVKNVWGHRGIICFGVDLK